MSNLEKLKVIEYTIFEDGVDDLNDLKKIRKKLYRLSVCSNEERTIKNTLLIHIKELLAEDRSYQKK